MFSSSSRERLQQRAAVCELAEDEALGPLWSAADDRRGLFEVWPNWLPLAWEDTFGGAS